MWAVCAGCLALVACYEVVAARRPPGPGLLLATLPLLACTLAAPAAADKAVVRGSIAFVTSWLTSFKLLSAAAGRGPLAAKQLTTAQRLAVLLLPLNIDSSGIRANRNGSSGNGGRGLLLLKLSAAAAVILLLHSAAWQPQWVRHLLCAVVIWLVVALLVDGPASALGPALGLALTPAMDRPYASHSLADFWGRRYNRIVSSSLRATVYDPLLAALAGNGCSDSSSSSSSSSSSGVQLAGSCSRQQQPHSSARGSSRPDEGRCSSEAARAIATVATFAVSGLMHELCVWQMCQTTYVASGQLLPGRQLLFFLLQAPLLLLERRLLGQTPPQQDWAWGPCGSAAADMDAVLPEPCASQGCQQQQQQQAPAGSRAAEALVAPAASKGVASKRQQSVHRRHIAASPPSAVGRAWVLQAVRRACTVALLLLLAEWLFWPPLESCKCDVNGIAEVSHALAVAGQRMAALFQCWRLLLGDANQ